MKQQVKIAEKNYEHMFNIDSIVPCISTLKNTNLIPLAYEDIVANDEPECGPVKKGSCLSQFNCCWILLLIFF